MIEETQATARPSIEDTVPTAPLRDIGDTQPMPPHTPAPIRSYRLGPRRSCLSTLVLLLAALLLAAGALAVLGYASTQWAASRPRLTILILGLDRRPEQGTAVRSDTMMLLTVNPPAPRAALLSIPRDLYVEIPGYGLNRVNTAHFWGENAAAGGGPALAMHTLAQNLGVPVQRYVRVDFEGFRAIVDAVGGIDVVVPQAIVDNEYPTDDYGTIRIEIPAGPQHMDGETALRYVRSRHGSTDFDRAARQQQVLLALAQRVLQPEAWPSLPTVYRAVLDHTDTDLTFGDMLVLATTLRRAGPESIEHRVIDQDMTQPWTTPDGAAVLLPRWELVYPLVQELFTP
jgi:LCP family protein required for cell wall assembly